MPKPKPTPLEREITTRQRRIERAETKIAEIRKKADADVADIQREVERDTIVLEALKAQKK